MPDENLDLGDFDLNIETSHEPAVEKKKQPLPQTPEEQNQFINEITKNIEKNRERFLAAVTNLKRSRALDSEKINILANIEKEFNELVIHGMEVFENKLKELLHMPRHINSYTKRYTQERKNKLLNYADEKEKMLLISKWEIQDELLNLLDNFSKTLQDILQLTNSQGINISGLSPDNKTLFEYAKASCYLSKDEIQELNQTIKTWQIEST